MKNIIYTSLFILLTFVSCTDDFDEVNTNPNAPNAVQSSLLLRQVIYNYAEEMSYEGFVAGDLLSQYRTALDFNLFDRHDLKSPQLGGNPWSIFYTNLRDNEIIINQANSNPVEAIYLAPALVLKAYMAANLTDLFGDVPYSDAFKGTDTSTTPAYDTQEDIYTAANGVLDNLDQAIVLIDNNTDETSLEGDLLFDGDLNAWKKMAVSLKMKYLLRISSKIDVSTEFNDLFVGNEYMKTNSDNAVFAFSANAPNNFRMSRLRIGDFNNFVLSETMEEILLEYNDTRIQQLFRPTATPSENDYNGLLNGIDPSETEVTLSNYSLAGTMFREDSSTLNANFITAWETYFILAEAALKGWISADPQNLYETGVALAFEYWNTPLPDDYLTGNAAYNNATASPLQQIITQKWIANVINGYEGWTEYRRTGFPTLKTISASLNNNLIPVRMPYPSDEITLNAQNYSTVANATDNNSSNIPVWWNQ